VTAFLRAAGGTNQFYNSNEILSQLGGSGKGARVNIRLP